jgi:nucleoid DNA-binding protein
MQLFSLIRVKVGMMGSEIIPSHGIADDLHDLTQEGGIVGVFPDKTLVIILRAIEFQKTIQQIAKICSRMEDHINHNAKIRSAKIEWTCFPIRTSLSDVIIHRLLTGSEALNKETRGDVFDLVFRALGVIKRGKRMTRPGYGTLTFRRKKSRSGTQTEIQRDLAITPARSRMMKLALAANNKR